MVNKLQSHTIQGVGDVVDVVYDMLISSILQPLANED